MRQDILSIRVIRRLSTLFRSEFLEEHAEKLEWSNVVGRSRYQPSFGHSFSAFAAGEGRTIADFQRCYNSTADKPLSIGGFYQRLTPDLAEYFSNLIETALNEVAILDSVILMLSGLET